MKPNEHNATSQNQRHGKHLQTFIKTKGMSKMKTYLGREEACDEQS